MRFSSHSTFLPTVQRRSPLETSPSLRQCGVSSFAPFQTVVCGRCSPCLLSSSYYLLVCCGGYVLPTYYLLPTACCAMAWGIISDVHGNLPALEAVLGEMGEVEGILCLGDVVGYGADVEECCRRIKGLDCSVLLKGNHEAGVIGELPISWFSRHALLALIWTRDNLSRELLNFISGFTLRATLGKGMVPQPESVGEATLCACAGDVLLMHGSLGEPYDYVDSAWKAEEVFRQTQAGLCFLGHTHFAGWFELPEEVSIERPVPPEAARRRPFGAITEIATGGGGCRWTGCPEGGLLRLEEGKRYVVNCGSVGQPRDGNPQAAFGLFDPVRGSVEFRRVEYDVEAAQESIRRAGLPEALAERLGYGG